MATTSTVTTAQSSKTMPSPSFISHSTTLTRHAYLVGTPISHSQSPLLHHTIYSSLGEDWGQILYETSDLPSFIAHLKSDPNCMGSGVTMPFKVAVIPYLDELTPEGRAIGAINTIFFKRSKTGERIYCGTNTDCIGIRDAFWNNVADARVYRGRPGLVIGGGGTSRAAVYALQQFLGCSPIYMVNRDKGEVQAVLEECRARGFGEGIVHVETVEEAERMEVPGAIVGCVPDFPPKTESERVVRRILAVLMGGENKGALLEMCYHPSPNTEIAKLARECGWQVIGGIEAMVGQGLEQARLWTGVEISQDLREKAMEVVRNGLASKHKL